MKQRAGLLSFLFSMSVACAAWAGGGLGSGNLNGGGIGIGVGGPAAPGGSGSSGGSSGGPSSPGSGSFPKSTHMGIWNDSPLTVTVVGTIVTETHEGYVMPYRPATILFADYAVGTPAKLTVSAYCGGQQLQDTCNSKVYGDANYKFVSFFVTGDCKMTLPPAGRIKCSPKFL